MVDYDTRKFIEAKGDKYLDTVKHQRDAYWMAVECGKILPRDIEFIGMIGAARDVVLEKIVGRHEDELYSENARDLKLSDFPEHRDQVEREAYELVGEIVDWLLPYEIRPAEIDLHRIVNVLRLHGENSRYF